MDYQQQSPSHLMVECKSVVRQAADTQIQMQQQMIANKRLDFEIARLEKLWSVNAGRYQFPPT